MGFQFDRLSLVARRSDMVETGSVSRYARAAQLAILVGLFAVPSSTALARTETLRWEHPDPAQA